MSDEASGGAGGANGGPSEGARDITDITQERTMVITGHAMPGADIAASRPTEPRAAWQRGQDALASLEREIGELAAAMHRHARALEPFVEGTFASDTADPRTQLLIQALDRARSADQRLGKLDTDLRRLRESSRVVDSDWSSVGAERERLATLYTIAQELNTSLDLDEVLGRVMALLIEVVRAERGAILLWDATEGALRFITGRDAAGQPVAEDQLALSRGVVDQVWTSRTPLLTTDAQSDERLRMNYSVVSYGIRSVMCAPLLTRGRGVGVVYVDSRHEARLFDQSSLDLLAAFCNQAAIAIENARLVSDLRANIRELDATRAFMENVFASIASGVITTDTGGRVTTLNLAAERMLGRGPGVVIGGPLTEALAAADGQIDSQTDGALAEALRRAIGERAATLGYELTRELAGRGEVSLRLNVTPLRDGEAPGDTGPAPLGVALTLEDLTELRRSQRQAREIRQIFGRYVHPAVVRQLLADPSAAHLGGETREISVVFADIRNFSQIAAQLAPDAVVSMLNHYLDLLTRAIWDEEGTLTMYIGDALMAIFNAPLPQPDHAARAVRAAWAMRQALQEADAQTGQPQTRAQYGIGVHTGLALVGNIGAPGRMQNYTAIGDTVNIASRLQTCASANQILLSAETCAACAGLALTRPLEPLAVKGRTQPLSVFQLDGLRDAAAPSRP
ncbi:MAG TPA: adenylate/guanylate cyclase domain-containing protein [Ktedonobacterales bacterium]|nr:adenylate/guanylate cyclase domain-containing protein [Ktedonobacterales bacterium]